MSKCRSCEQQKKKARSVAPRPKGERNFGRARIMSDGSVIYPKKGWEPPPPLHGYERDPGNAWRFIPLWPECKHRTQVTRFKPCGAIDIVTRCMCPLAGSFKAEVRLSDCEGCSVRQP